MITLVVLIVALLFLFCLTFGIRTRQPLAVVASFLLLATLFGAYGWLTAGMMTGDRLAAEIWLAGSALSLVLAGFLAFIAWRRASSGSR